MSDTWEGVPLFEHLDGIVGRIVSHTGLPFDQLRTLLIFILSYILAVAHRYVPSTQRRHLFTAVSGLLLATYWLGLPVLHAVGTSLAVYIIVHVSTSRKTPSIVTAILMFYLAGCHIYRQISTNLEWNVDFSLPQMILTIRLSTFVFQVYDGKKLAAGKKLKVESDGNLAVSSMPNVIEYFGFVFYFGSFFAGPYVQIREYLEFTDRTMFKDCPGKAVPWPPAKKVISTVIIMLLCFYAAVFSFHKFNEKLFLKEDFVNASFLGRCWIITVVGMFYRMKYFTAWNFAEITSLFSGLSFNGYEKDEDGKQVMNFDRCQNTDILKLETMSSLHEGVVVWNTGVHRWLRRYVYVRLTPEGEKGGWKQSLVVSFVSAFWHGFYPGYYLFFLSLALHTEANRIAHRHYGPLFKSIGKRFGMGNTAASVYHFGGIVLTRFLVDYNAAPFQLMSLTEGVKVYNSMYWIGHIIVILSWVFGLVYFERRKGSKKPHHGKQE